MLSCVPDIYKQSVHRNKRQMVIIYYDMANNRGLCVDTRDAPLSFCRQGLNI